MATDLLTVVIVVLGLLLSAALPYLLVESKWRWRWREVEVGRLPTHLGEQSLYRDAGTVPTYLRRAPRMIRIAAFTCFLFGQMFVPGLLMGAFGLIAGGIGLVSIPGLITAAKLYASGLALLRREPRVAYFKTRNAAAWALWLNGIVFAGSLIIGAVVRMGAGNEVVWAFIAFFNGYGLLSALQAWLCLRATSRYEDALFLPTEATKVNGTWYRAQPTARAA
jgi:hypothetical protein